MKNGIFSPTINHPHRYVSFSFFFFTFWFTPRSQKDQHSSITEYPHSGYISRTKFRNLMKYLVTGAKLIRSPTPLLPSFLSISSSLSESFLYLNNSSDLSKQLNLFWKTVATLALLGKRPHSYNLGSAFYFCPQMC